MNNLITIPRNGSLTKTTKKRNTNFPSIMNLFDDLMYGDFPAVFSSNYSDGISMPKVNIREFTDSFHIDMAVPGLKKSNFEVNLDNSTLSISAKTESSESENEYTRREFSYSSFNRNFILPETIDESKIDAKYEDGILKIVMPKKDEAKEKTSRIINIT